MRSLLRQRSSVATFVAALITLIAGFATLAVAPAGAAVDVPLVESGSSPLQLTGGITQYNGSITIPDRWTSWSGSVHLRWTGSSELASGSALRVTLGGRVLGSADVKAGGGAISFVAPRTSVRKGQTSIPITIEARLKTKTIQCPGPDDLSAYLQFSADSGVTLNGAWSQTPLKLSDLPAALVTTIGRQPSGLLIRFAQAPNPSTLAAAAVAAGEVDAAASGGGLKVRVSQPSAQLKPTPYETVLTISQTTGPGQLKVGSSTGVAPRVVIAGAADQLVKAAGGLRPSIARTLEGTAASNLPAIAIKRSDLPRRIQLSAGQWTGYGSGTISLPFELPIWREALRGARIRMSVSYDAPAGGRAQVVVNGRTIDTETLKEQGSTRFSVEEELAGRGPALQRADLRAGQNQVEVNADLNYPSNRCTLPDETGSVTVSDFGSVTLLTRARPVQTTLSTFPYPLDRNPGWAGATVQVPPSPTNDELASVLSVLAESRRVTDEPSMPTFRIAADAPRGPALILAREGSVPASLVKDVPGPKDAGVLAASGTGTAVQITAIGVRALD
ncbi:MAG: cellulose biosynthesis cyclic di-GMP-binding regulatory protein BcsB, partial [Solirubrobacteraceae bacterium]